MEIGDRVKREINIYQPEKGFKKGTIIKNMLNQKQSAVICF